MKLFFIFSLKSELDMIIPYLEAIPAPKPPSLTSITKKAKSRGVDRIKFVIHKKKNLLSIWPFFFFFLLLCLFCRGEIDSFSFFILVFIEYFLYRSSATLQAGVDTVHSVQSVWQSWIWKPVKSSRNTAISVIQNIVDHLSALSDRVIEESHKIKSSNEQTPTLQSSNSCAVEQNQDNTGDNVDIMMGKSCGETLSAEILSDGSTSQSFRDVGQVHPIEVECRVQLHDGPCFELCKPHNESQSKWTRVKSNVIYYIGSSLEEGHFSFIKRNIDYWASGCQNKVNGSSVYTISEVS